MARKPKIKKSEYENLYDCIRTDQVPPDQIAYWFTDEKFFKWYKNCLLYTSPSPRDVEESRMPSSA